MFFLYFKLFCQSQLKWNHHRNEELFIVLQWGKLTDITGDERSVPPTSHLYANMCISNCYTYGCHCIESKYIKRMNKQKGMSCTEYNVCVFIVSFVCLFFFSDQKTQQVKWPTPNVRRLTNWPSLFFSPGITKLLRVCRFVLADRLSSDLWMHRLSRHCRIFKGPLNLAGLILSLKTIIAFW